MARFDAVLLPTLPQGTRKLGYYDMSMDIDAYNAGPMGEDNPFHVCLQRLGPAGHEPAARHVVDSGFRSASSSSAVRRMRRCCSISPASSRSPPPGGTGGRACMRRGEGRAVLWRRTTGRSPILRCDSGFGVCTFTAAAPHPPLSPFVRYGERQAKRRAQLTCQGRTARLPLPASAGRGEGEGRPQGRSLPGLEPECNRDRTDALVYRPSRHQASEMRPSSPASAAKPVNSG